jgi:hypothetical protein
LGEGLINNRPSLTSLFFYQISKLEISLRLVSSWYSGWPNQLDWPNVKGYIIIYGLRPSLII